MVMAGSGNGRFVACGDLEFHWWIRRPQTAEIPTITMQQGEEDVLPHVGVSCVVSIGYVGYHESRPDFLLAIGGPIVH
jgi:hypothetical protein